jgi:geranylgeranyl pyrophosphate synthase
MTALPRAAEMPALLSLLDKLFLDGDDADARLARSLPSALWSDALLAPLRDFLARPSKGFRAELVSWGYRLAHPGASVDHEAREARTELPVLALIIECLHAGSLIIDDIEDASEERRGAPALHCSFGVPRALNAGNYLYFWPQLLLARSGLSDAARLQAHERIALCLTRCHEGQALDLQVRADQLPQRDVAKVALAITRLKTGGLVALAMALGALAAGAPPERVDAVAGLGRALGVGLQMLDDVSGIVNIARRHKALEDLRHGRVTWLWAILSEELDAAAYEARLRELRSVMDGGAADVLVERLRFQLGALGVRRAHAYVQAALSTLETTLGPGAWAEEVLGQFARLERRYVQG